MLYYFVTTKVIILRNALLPTLTIHTRHIRTSVLTSYTLVPPSMKMDSIFSANGGDASDSTASPNDLQTKCAPKKASLGCLLKTTVKRFGKGCNFGGNESQVLRPITTAFCFSTIKANQI